MIAGEGVPGPIPWDRTELYAARHGLDTENTDLLVHVIREMDAGYLKWYENKLATMKPKKRNLSNGRLRYKRHR